MKKTIIFLAAAALVFAACQKEQSSPVNAGGLQLTATVEQQGYGDETKTYLGNDLNVLWSENDKVNVFTDASTPEKLTLTLTDGAGTTSGNFNTSEACTGNPRYAIYPASNGNSINGSTITFTLPATQSYVANSFANGANVAVGKVSNGNVAYKNVCGVLKLSVLGDITVSKIELSGNNSEILCGTFTADASNVYGVATYSTGGGTTLTLDCGNGVALNYCTATAFYFVVPVGAFAGGFTVTVYEKESSETYEFSTTSSNVIKRSTIKAMPELFIIPKEYQRVNYLESTGTQYINTQISAPEGVLLTGKIAYTGGSGYQINGAEDGAPYNRNYPFGSYKYGESYVWYIGAGTNYSYYPFTLLSLNTVYEVEGSTIINKDAYLKVNGETVLTITNNNTTLTSNPMYLFASNGYSKGYCNLRIYDHLSIYNGENTMLGIFVPCKRIADSKPGMYDLVTKTFFVNQGEGDDFIVGDVVVD